MKDKTSDLMIVFHDLRLGGIQRKILDICQYLQKENHPPLLALYHRRGIFLSPISKVCRIISPRFHTQKLDTIFFTLWLTFQFIKYRPPTIICFIGLSSLPTLLAKSLLFYYHPKIIICEDILTSQYIQTESYPHIKKLLTKILYPLADKIFVQTKIQKQDLSEIIGQEYNKKIIITPNWLPLHTPALSSNNPKTNDILYIGRIEDQKNLSEFVEIIRELSKIYPQISAQIIGSGTHSQLIKKLVKKYSLQNNIKFIAPTLNVGKFYQSSKVFLLTSHFEGFPLTILEAISYQCFPIAKNIPELKTFFQKDQKYFLYSTVKNAANMIIKELNYPQTELINSYQKKVLSDQSQNFAKFFRSI